jgi:hypothetical protein
MCCSVCIAKSWTQVAFGQGNSFYARSFGMPKCSKGIGGRFIFIAYDSEAFTKGCNSEKLDKSAGSVANFAFLF